VRLRGLLLRGPSGSDDQPPGHADRLVKGLAAQAEFLTHRAGPATWAAGPHRDGPLHILVIPRPPGPSWTELFGAGDRPLDQYAVPLAIDTLVGVAGELIRLHRQRQAHRALDGDVILVPGKGRRATLRDPGRAWWPGLPGEGDVRYPAPEQRALAAGRPGPATDVYQLAALFQHTCAGHPPTTGTAIRLRVFLPGLPDLIDDLLRRAFDPDPGNRPSMAELAAGFRQARGPLLSGAGA
jgi:serine/threonine protein kinase